MNIEVSRKKLDLSSAIAEGDIRVLLMVLVHMTGDERWLEPPYKPKRDVRLIPDPEAGVPAEIQAEIRAAVLKLFENGEPKPVITDPGDELYGLKPDDIEKGQKQAANRNYPTLGKAYRSKRSPQEGLLLIYPISANSIPGKNAKNRIQLFGDGEERRTVLGFAVSFPFSDSPATVTYVQGPESRRK